MKYLRHISAVLLLTAVAAPVLWMSCRTRRNDTPHRPTKDPAVYKGVINQECAVEMSYGSYGAGIDDSAYTATMKLISRWNQNYTSTNIGREGETRLCLPLAGLEKKQRRIFIDSLTNIARKGRLVSVAIR